MSNVKLSNVVGHRVWGYDPPEYINSKDRVKNMQEALRAHGYHIVADGIWGPKTDAAYKDARAREKAEEQRTININGITNQAIPVSDAYSNGTGSSGKQVAPYTRREGTNETKLPDAVQNKLNWNRSSAVARQSLYSQVNGIIASKVLQQGQRYESAEDIRNEYQPQIASYQAQKQEALKTNSQWRKPEYRERRNQYNDAYHAGAKLEKERDAKLSSYFLWRRLEGEAKSPFYSGYDNVEDKNIASIQKEIVTLGKELWYAEEAQPTEQRIKGIGTLTTVRPEAFFHTDSAAQALGNAFIAVGNAVSETTASINYLHNDELAGRYLNEAITGNYRTWYDTGRKRTDKSRGNPRIYGRVAEDAYTPDGFIKDQKPLKELCYGIGNISENGCGAVAVYNALKVLEPNEQKNFAEVIHAMEPGCIALAKAGTNPFYIANIFRNWGYDVEINLTREKIERIAPKSDVNIWFYVWMDNKPGNQVIGAHYATCVPIGNGKYHFYNGEGSLKDGIGSLEDHYMKKDGLRMMISISHPKQ